MGNHSCTIVMISVGTDIGDIRNPLRKRCCVGTGIRMCDGHVFVGRRAPRYVGGLLVIQQGAPPKTNRVILSYDFLNSPTTVFVWSLFFAEHGGKIWKNWLYFTLKSNVDYCTWLIYSSRPRSQKRTLCRGQLSRGLTIRRTPRRTIGKSMLHFALMKSIYRWR